MKKINRNAWSATEMDTLISVVKELSLIHI